MSRSIQGIPKSMEPQIDPEMDLAADKLQELARQGLAQPTAEPAVPSEGQMLGQGDGQPAALRHSPGARRAPGPTNAIKILVLGLLDLDVHRHG
jgi:hypothetical protein